METTFENLDKKNGGQAPSKSRINQKNDDRGNCISVKLSGEGLPSEQTDTILIEEPISVTATADGQGIKSLVAAAVVGSEDSPSTPTIHVQDVNESKDIELIIHPDLDKVLPPLTDEEYADLRNQIINDGCRDAIVIWNGIIVDGKYRYLICKSAGIPFNTIEKVFASLDEAMVWRIDNQKGKRNLNKYQKLVLGWRKAELLAPQAKANQLSGLKQNATVFLKAEKRSEPINLTKDAADFAKVSSDTASKVRKILDCASDEDKKLLETEDKSINEVYKSIIGKEKLQTLNALQEGAQIETMDKTQEGLPVDPHWSNISLIKLRELKVKELVDTNAVLFVCYKSPEKQDTVTGITAKGCVTINYDEWKKMIGSAYNLSVSKENTLRLVQEKIENIQQKKINGKNSP